jgi:uncharacterized protein
MDIIKTLKKHEKEIREKYKVKKIGVFGSYVRGDIKETSDIDVLVEFERPIGWEFFDIKEFLEEILGKDVDLVTVGALKPQLKDRVLKEVVYA